MIFTGGSTQSWRDAERRANQQAGRGGQTQSFTPSRFPTRPVPPPPPPRPSIPPSPAATPTPQAAHEPSGAGGGRSSGRVASSSGTIPPAIMAAVDNEARAMAQGTPTPSYTPTPTPTPRPSQASSPTATPTPTPPPPPPFLGFLGDALAAVGNWASGLLGGASTPGPTPTPTPTPTQPYNPLPNPNPPAMYVNLVVPPITSPASGSAAQVPESVTTSPQQPIAQPPTQPAVQPPVQPIAQPPTQPTMQPGALTKPTNIDELANYFASKLPGTGAEFVNWYVVDAAWPGTFEAFDAWVEDFTQRHGYPPWSGAFHPTEVLRENLAAREWSMEFARRHGRPPTEREYQEQWYADRFGLGPYDNSQPEFWGAPLGAGWGRGFASRWGPKGWGEPWNRRGRGGRRGGGGGVGQNNFSWLTSPGRGV